MRLKNRKGVILITGYLVIVVLTILGSAFVARSINERRLAQRERNFLQALYLAEAGIDQATREIMIDFSSYFYDMDTGARMASVFAWFAGTTTPSISDYSAPSSASLDQGRFPGEYTVVVGLDAASVDTIEGRADIILTSTGDINGTSRTVKTIVRYQLVPSRVFDYSYFINNFGWFWGGGITANGDIRSNGDFSFNGNPVVNGDIYASVNPDLGANGDISGNSTNDTIAFYRDHTDDQARPTNPTADPDASNDYEYPHGYDGDSERFAHQELLEMPYLGNLQNYKNLAVGESGTISQGGTVLVNAVYGDEASESGPDGISGTVDDGCIVLVGTAANPIELNGPVVVEKDVLIKGAVTGQGIIYSGRNTHIIGDIVYADPPIWTKPDTDSTGTDAVNATKDFLGLASKGNVIIGDYTRNDWQTTVGPYLQPPFTQAYDTDATDVVNGYDSDGNPVNGYRFDGDYTANDGGFKDDGAGGGASRKYFESSLSDDYVHNISEPSNQIRHVDAVSYTNHAYTGRAGDFIINGSIISRDEAIIYSGHITMNYDVRAKDKGYDFHLPRELDQSPELISWEEN